MNIITDRPIYSNVEGEAKMKPLGAKELSLKTPDKLQSAKPMSAETIRAKDKLEKKANRSKRREEQKLVRQEKRASRKASRTAKKLLRAKDKNGKKRWFYPLSQVFKGKKKAADGSIVEVAQKDIVTTSNGTQFDKTEISKAMGIPVENITASTVENSAVTHPANSKITENTQLTDFKKNPPEPASKSTESVQNLNEMTIVSVGVSDSREIISLPTGETYLSQETLLQEEQEPDPKKKTTPAEEQKGLGVWGWVGVSAIVVGLGVGAYLLYSMSTSKK